MRIICIQSPRYDYLTATLNEGLQELGHEMIASEDSNYTCKTPDKLLRRRAENADLIIVYSNWKVRTSLVQDIEHPMTVFVDGSDQQEFYVYPHMRFRAVFKRELNKLWQSADGEPVFPLPFAAEKRYFSKSAGAGERDLTLSFAASMVTNTFRHSLWHRLAARKSPAIFAGSTGESAYDQMIGQPIETPKFRELLRRSRVSVNAVGIGYDCGRFWEILASGAMLLTQELDIQMPQPFTDGKNCLVFKSLEDFDDKVDRIFAGKIDVEGIARAGYEHLVAHHTTAKRAEYFLGRVASLKGDGQVCNSFYKGPPQRRSLPKHFVGKIRRTVGRVLGRV